MPIKRLKMTEDSLFHPHRVVAGEIFAPTQDQPFSLHYQHPHGCLFRGDSIAWLKSLDSQTVDLIFADPPYNIRKAEWDCFEDEEAYIEWSMAWLSSASRVLRPTGSLYICGFSEILATLRHPASKLFRGCRWLVWCYRNKANLGNDWGRSHESILHFRKSPAFRLNVDEIRVPYGRHTLRYPSHPQAASSQYGNGDKRDAWTPNPLGGKPKDVIEIPTTCNGMGEKTPHPTQKPEELLRKLVLAASRPGDLVVDPFSGSGTTAVVAEQLGRRWVACERNPQYNEWAIDRIESVRKMSVEEWIDFDRRNVERRESIR